MPQHTKRFRRQTESMSQKVNSGQVVVSDSAITVSEVTSNGIVFAPTVSVEKIHSGGIVVADTVENVAEVFSGGIVVTPNLLSDVEFYSGGKHAESVSELVAQFIGGGADATLLQNAYDKPHEYNEPSGLATEETTIAKIGEARDKAGDVLTRVELAL